MVKKLSFVLFLCLIITIVFSGCNTNNIKENTMEFKFEAIDFSEYEGGSYLMDFGEMVSEEDAAIVEGKLLTVFGAPAVVSDNYENSFNYIIRATANDGRATVLNVYNVGVVHIGALTEDEFTLQAANALVKYVNSAKPTDYERTVYYLDFDLQIDISVKDGKVKIGQSQISEEKASELINKWYK